MLAVVLIGPQKEGGRDTGRQPLLSKIIFLYMQNPQKISKGEPPPEGGGCGSGFGYGLVVFAGIRLAVVVTDAADLQALIAEHESLAADRAERLEAHRVGIPLHLDLALAVGTHFGDDVGPVVLAVLDRFVGVDVALQHAGVEHDALGLHGRQVAHLTENRPLLGRPVLGLPDEGLFQIFLFVTVLNLHSHNRPFTFCKFSAVNSRFFQLFR